MSNRSEFDFDDDEEFEFENDEFGFDDDEDIDFESGLGDDFDDDELVFDEDEADSRGPSRTFIIIAVLMIGMFVIALVALFFFSGAFDTGPSPIQQTSTVIAATNVALLALGAETETQAFFDRQTETQVALDLTLTAQAPTATPTNTPTSTPTETPAPDETELAATAFAQQLALTQTALALPTITNTPDVTEAPDVPGISAIAQTATALAGFLVPPTIDPDDLDAGGGLIATPTPEGFPPGLPTALPDTGLLDDLMEGGPGSMGMILLMIFGLAGVIFVSRRLRSLNQ